MPRNAPHFLPGLVAPSLFLALHNLVWYRAGSLPVIPASSGFPYRLADLSAGDILIYFEREPPLFLLYAKTLSILFDPVFPAVAIGNLLMVMAMLFMAYSFLSRYLRPGFAVSICVFAALGLEFFLYTISTRQEMLTAFFLFLLFHAHTTFFAPHRTGRRGRIAASLAVPALAVALVLTRPTYLAFILIYLLALLLSDFFRLLRRDLGTAGLTGWSLCCAAMLALPALLMLKNDRLYDHFSLGSRGYEGLQRAVFSEIQGKYVFDARQTFQRFLSRSQTLDPRAKQFYAAGAPWPTTRDEIRQMLSVNTANTEYARLLRTWYPRKEIPSPLYSHPESGNGYLFGPGIRLGHEVAQSILLQKPFDTISGMARNAAPLAACYSSHWFYPAYGRRLCAADHGFLALLLKPHQILSPGRTAALHHQQSPADFKRNLKAFLGLMPGPITGLHLLFQRYFLWPLLAIALLHLLANLYSLLSRRPLDQGLLLLTALICYSFLAAVFLDFGDNMRPGIHYKLPLFCYFGWLLSRTGLGSRT